MKRLISVIVLSTITIFAFAGTPVVAPNLGTKTEIAPLWFGPNAFPVPEMSDGQLGTACTVELAGDYFQGHLADGKDLTYDAFIRIHLPLWSERAALTVWMPVVEFWQTDATVDAARHILSDRSKDPGHDSGDVYISLDIQLVSEGDLKPSVLLRSVLKTASGNNFGYARYYDAPGYFFDLTAGKSFGPVRLTATTGFLCWQTDNGRQNDAVQYGLGAFLTLGELRASAEWGGYTGWERHGDSPKTLKSRLSYRLGQYEPFVFIQHGLHDWPFTQLRAGVVYRW